MSRARNLTTLALLLAGAVYCIPLASGYFLADDFVQLANFAHWRSQGGLGAEVLARLAASVDGANAFWRPLTYASFAGSYLASGAHASGWLAVNLALHLANSALVGLLVRRLAGPESGTTGALFAAIAFFMLASGWEAVLWISGRYDTLATLFVLLAGWLFAGGRSRSALAATALALASKESGAVAFVLIACIAGAREIGFAGRGSLAGRLARSLSPFVVLGIAYTALRIALFGQATRAYQGLEVDLASPAHWAHLWSTGSAWARAVFPGPAELQALGAFAAVGLVAIGVAAASRPARPALTGLLVAFAVTSLLMLTHLPAFDPSGVGGRLLYLPGALFAGTLGLSLAACLERGDRRAWRIAARTLAAMCIVAHVHWMYRATVEYHRAHQEMRAVARAIAAIAAGSPSPAALILLPDRLGRVPFGMNAQAGLVLPPVQREDLTRRVLVQLDYEIPELPGKVARGVIDWLTRRGFSGFIHGSERLPGTSPVEPSAYYCWSAARRFEPMNVAPGEPPTLGMRVDVAYSAAGCRR